MNEFFIGRPGPIKKVNDEQIRRLRETGLTLQAIADQIQAPKSTVQSSLERTKKFIHRFLVKEVTDLPRSKQ